MVDPLLEGFDMPLIIDFPILAKDIPHLDAVFVTHAGNDHFSIPTNITLSKITDVYYSTMYVHSLTKNLNLKSVGHEIGDTFRVKNIFVKLTPADHSPDFSPFNGDPKKLYDVVINPERIRVLAPGEPFVLKRLKK